MCSGVERDPNGGELMAGREDLAERLRAVLTGTGAVREIKMFGGLCFTLNGNMVAGASKQGLLLRVGKERHAEALARPGARAMEMKGQPMAGYVFVDPPPDDAQALHDWLDMAVAFVSTLPPKLPKSKARPKRTE
jgi:TfoX/Sxy family transcriptional regulator of competence genes